MDLLLSQAVPTLPAAEAARDTALIRLDTRSWEEYAVSHLPGARWIGDTAFQSARVRDLPRDRRVLVYCSVGVRSERIGTQLQALGFDSVYNLAGGLFEWHNQGFALENAYGQPTDSIHGYAPSWGVWIQGGTVVYAAPQEP